MAKDATLRRRRRPRHTATIRAAILERVEARGLSLLQVANLSGVPRTVVHDFLGENNRDVGLSYAERIWQAVGLDVRKVGRRK